MARSKVVDDEVERNRKAWKQRFKEASNRNRPLSASEVAAAANRYLRALDRAEPELRDAHIHSYRSGGRDMRVPQNPKVANALVWALEDCGAWEGVPTDSAATERGQLIELLGFRSLRRPSEELPPQLARLPGLNDLPGGQVMRGKDGVMALLHKVQQIARSELDELKQAKRGDQLVEDLVVTISSSTGFHTARDAEVDAAIVECLSLGVRFVYVIGQDWADWPPESVCWDLRTSLEIALKGAKPLPPHPEKISDRLLVARLPKPDVPSWPTRVLRTALLGRLLTKPDDGRLTVHHLLLSEPIGGWAEVLPDFHSRDSGLNLWVVLANTGMAAPALKWLWSQLSDSQKGKVELEPMFQE